MSKSSSGASSQSTNHNQSTGNQLNGGHQNASSQQSHQQQLNPHLIKGQQTNAANSGQLPSIHDQLTGLTIKTNQAVAAANAILNCSPLSSTSTSPLASHSHLQSNLSANSSPDSHPSSNSPSLANRTKDAKIALNDCKPR